jgi:hypothetical protein
MDVAVRANGWHDSGRLASAHAWTTARLTALGTTARLTALGTPARLTAFGTPARLTAFGTPACGPIEEVWARPWSVTHRVPTASGPVWFKANTMDCADEAVLAEALARSRPDAVLEPLAVDAERGWMLTADAGTTLRESGVPAERRLEVWAGMLRAFAALQRAVAPRAAELVALGVPDLRPSLVPGRLTSLLADPQVRTGLGEERAAAVEAVVPRFADWCAELAADGVPRRSSTTTCTTETCSPRRRVEFLLRAGEPVPHLLGVVAGGGRLQPPVLDGALVLGADAQRLADGLHGLAEGLGDLGR